MRGSKAVVAQVAAGARGDGAHAPPCFQHRPPGAEELWCPRCLRRAEDRGSSSVAWPLREGVWGGQGPDEGLGSRTGLWGGSLACPALGFCGLICEKG